MADNNSPPKATNYYQQSRNLGGKRRKAIPWNKKQGGKILNLTVKFKIVPTKEQTKILEDMTNEYITTINSIIEQMIKADGTLKLTSKDITANLPSAVKNQAIRDAKSVYNKYKKEVKTNSKKPKDKQKEVKVPILKKPVCLWNNQNYSCNDNILSFPVNIDGKTKRITVKALISDYQLKYLQYKLGTLRITQKSGKWVAQISVSMQNSQPINGQIMGVDLGLKVPAVAITEAGKTKFFGNGRMNKYIRRKYKTIRQQLGKAKKLKKIKQISDKEHRWMKDKDHKISRQIVNFAIANNVSVIRMERLTNIRNTTRTSRKNEKNLHTWSFYRLAKFIEYKATLAGIKVEYVNPKYTSQICPNCGTLNKAKDRKYKCVCGHKTHRDRVGAINILRAPVANGVA